MIAVWVHRFFEDARTQTALLLILLDLGLGVLAGIVTHTFRLSFIADFLRNDVLGKVLPFFLVYGGYLFAKNADIVIPGLDLEVITDGVWVITLAALVGSLLASLKELGIPILSGAPDAIAGPDPATPVVPPPSG